MINIQAFIAFLGRLFIAILFIWAGVAKLMNLAGTAGYMSKHMPYVWLFLPTAIFIQIIGALLLLTGYRARLGAAILIIFIIPATILFHGYWNLTGTERLTEQIMFMKDMGVLGGLLAFLAFGPGQFSLGKTY